MNKEQKEWIVDLFNISRNNPDLDIKFITENNNYIDDNDLTTQKIYKIEKDYYYVNEDRFFIGLEDIQNELEEYEEYYEKGNDYMEKEAKKVSELAILVYLDML